MSHDLWHEFFIPVLQYCVQLLWLCVKDDIMHQRTCDFEDEVSKLLGDQVELNLHLV